MSWRVISFKTYGGVRKIRWPSWRMLCPKPGSFPGSFTLKKENITKKNDYLVLTFRFK